MSAVLTCRFCGLAITVQDPAATHVACPHCGASLPVDAQWNPGPGDQAGAAASTGATAAPIEKPRRFPFISLLLVFPFATLILCTSITMVSTQQWGGLVVGLILGGGLMLVTLFRMRGRWTVGRTLFASAVVIFWLGICISMELEKSAIRKTFGPLKTEFAGFQIPDNRQKHPIKPKLFPLFLQGRGKGDFTADRPALPQMLEEVNIYKDLPPNIKATTPEEVRSIAMIEWGWENNNTVGTCKVVVIDRKSREVVAAKTLRGPPPGAMASIGRATQPSEKDVIAYLSTLPLEAATAEADPDDLLP